MRRSSGKWWLGGLALAVVSLVGLRTLAPAAGEAASLNDTAAIRAALAAHPPSDVSAQDSPLRLELLGYSDLDGEGLNADVALHRGYAYVGSWAAGSERGRGCPGRGVTVVDLTDPSQPKPVAHLAEHPGTTAEVMRVRAVDTPFFKGDLLAVGLQACGGEAPRGADLWDVTDPRNPRPLAFFATGVGGVHELDLIQRVDGRVLALLTVPFSEGSHPEHLGDLRIVDVTNPREPRALADWGVRAGMELGDAPGLGSDAQLYAHGVRASDDGLRAYVSYWDAGVVILDLADPAAPRAVGRTRFPPGVEGNAHSVDLARGEQILIEADEILDVTARAVQVDGPPALAGMIAAAGTLPAAPWPETSRVSGALVYLGRGCPAGDWAGQLGGLGERVEPADAYAGNPQGRIALIERGACPFSDKIERAKAAGALGAVIINSADAPLAPTGSGGPLGAFGIPRSDGERLKAALAANQTVEVTLAGDLRGYHDFGGLRFWDLTDPANPRALSTYETPRTHVDPTRGPSEEGRFTAHNPVVRGNLLFVSWFSDGVRVLDIADPANPREVASWVPPARERQRAVPTYLGEGPQVWGVDIAGDLVVVSDINGGLYTLRLVR